MVKSRILNLIIGLTVVLSLAGGLFAMTGVVLAQSPTPSSSPTDTVTPSTTPTPTTPLLTLQTDVPSYTDDSGATFSYNVSIQYSGAERQTATLSSSTASPGWTTSVSYSGQQVNSIDIGPAQSFGPDTKSVQVSLIPPPSQRPDPGSYVVTLKVTIGTLTETIDLTGVVKAKYAFSMNSSNQNLTTSANAGEDNHFSVTLTNSGSIVLNNITFSSKQPENWVIKFNPPKVDSITPGQTQQVDVIITPPSGKTVPGDYIVTLKAGNDKVDSSIDVRVTATTTSIWGWIGIIIFVVLVVGLIVLFFRLTRR